jgi:integrase
MTTPTPLVLAAAGAAGYPLRTAGVGTLRVLARSGAGRGPASPVPATTPRRARLRRARHADLTNPWLVRARQAARELAEARGWSRWVTASVDRALVVVLSGHAHGEQVRYSEASQVRSHGLADHGRRAAEVLDQLGAATANCARSPATTSWPLSSRCVAASVLTALTALRSLFGCCKRRGTIFRDPTSRIRVGRHPDPVLVPLEQRDVDQAVAAAAASTAEQRLVLALAAIHAARPLAIRSLLLDDLDLGNRRLTIAGRTRPLDELTRRALLDWLTYRRARWPNTANPHVLITQHTANETGPISRARFGEVFFGLAASLDRLRIDRQLEEALSATTDPAAEDPPWPPRS